MSTVAAILSNLWCHNASAGGGEVYSLPLLFTHWKEPLLLIIVLNCTADFKKEKLWYLYDNLLSVFVFINENKQSQESEESLQI